MASNATHYNNLTPAKPLDKATLNKMVFRSLNLQASFNYERMQAAGWLYCILPGLEKIHGDNKEDLKLSMEHNLEFFNTHPFLVTFVMGIILSLEQQKADREAYYQDLAIHPETYVPSTVPEETAGKPSRKPPPSPPLRHNKPYPNTVPRQTSVLPRHGFRLPERKTKLSREKNGYNPLTLQKFTV